MNAADLDTLDITAVKNTIISTKLLLGLSEGKTLDVVWEELFGPGSYRELADQIYDMLRAKARA